METARRYIDGFNSGDATPMAAACADPMQILDGMPPHVWQGSTAAEDWWRDALAEGEYLGVSGYHIVLAEPRHVDVTGDHAYVVAPVTFCYQVKGRQVTQTDAFFSVALRKMGTAGAWRPGLGQKASRVRRCGRNGM
jgi:SnoaL-like domain